MFPSKENISSSWCHLPPGCLNGIQSTKSPGLRCHQSHQIKPLLSLHVWSTEVFGDKQASHCLHPLLPKEQDPVSKCCQCLLTFRELGITSDSYAPGGELGIKGAGNAFF